MKPENVWIGAFVLVILVFISLLVALIVSAANEIKTTNEEVKHLTSPSSPPPPPAGTNRRYRRLSVSQLVKDADAYEYEQQSL